MARKKKRSATAADNLRMLIVEARFYDAISDELLRGATRVLDKAGARYDRVTVPGALEIPAAIAIAIDAAKRRRAPYDGVVALGCVIRGETAHFDVVVNESARGLQQLAIEHQLCIGNGIITVENEAQAWDRAKKDRQDKGGQAALAGDEGEHQAEGHAQLLRRGELKAPEDERLPDQRDDDDCKQEPVRPAGMPVVVLAEVVDQAILELGHNEMTYEVEQQRNT